MAELDPIAQQMKEEQDAQDAQGQADGGVDPIAAQMRVEQDQAEKTQANLMRYRAANDTTDPVKRADVLRYSAATGIAPELVESNLDQVKRETDASKVDWGEVIQRQPMLTKYLDEVPEATALVKDDVANLKGLEWAFKAPWKAMQDAYHVQKEIIPRQFAIAQGFGDEETEQAVREAQAKYEGRDYGAENWFTKGIVGLGQNIPMVVGDISARFLGGLGGAALGGGEAAAVSAPAGGAAAPVGAITFAAAGQFLGSSIFNYYESVGPLYWKLSQLKDSNGHPMDPTVARVMSQGAALLNGGLMAGLMGKVTTSLPGVKQLMAKASGTVVEQALAQRTVAEGVKRFVVRVGEGVATGAVAMAAQSAVNATAEEAAKMDSGQPFDVRWSNVLSAGAEGFKSGLQDMWLLAAIGPGHEMLKDIGRAHQVEVDQARFQGLVEKAKDSKLLDRSPEQAEKAMSHMVSEEGSAKTAYIPVDDWSNYWQAKKVDPGEMAATVMDDGGRGFAEAMNTKGDVAIPMEKLVSKLGKTEHLGALTEDVKLDPTSNTPRQEKAYQKQLAERMKEEAKVRGSELEQGKKAVFEFINEQAKAAGIDKEDAAANAKIVAETSGALATRLGVSVEEAAARAGLGRLRVLGPKGAAVAEAARRKFQEFLAPAASKRLKERLGTLSPENRAREYYLDHVSGLRHRRAFDALPTPEGKKVAVITTPEIKGINDDLVKGGHDVANGLLRHIGRSLYDVDPNAARSGTNFLFHVENEAQLQEAIAKVKAQLPHEKINIVGGLSENADQAFAELDKTTEDARKAGTIPERGKLAEGLDVGSLKFTDEKAKSVVPEHLVPEVGKLTDQQYFEQVYLDRPRPTKKNPNPEPTGLLSAEGWHAAQKGAYTLAIDLKNVKHANSYGKRVGDDLIATFATIQSHFGGSSFSAAHLSGDEFAATHNDPLVLEAHAKRLKEVLKNVTIGVENPATGKIDHIPVDFRYGIGRDYGEADRKLNIGRRREKQQAEVRGNLSARSEADRSGRATPDGRATEAGEQGSGRAPPREASANPQGGSAGQEVASQASGETVSRVSGDENSPGGDSSGISDQAQSASPEAGQASSLPATQDFPERTGGPSDAVQWGGGAAPQAYPGSSLNQEALGHIEGQPVTLESAGVQEARDLISRMRDPEKKAMAQAWLEYTQGLTDKRPKITDDLERELARYGVVDPEGYTFGEDGRSLHRVYGKKRPTAGEEPEYFKRMRMETRALRTGKYEQPAWHGSPHDFEKFSLHKIGSGEGAQAYGWGLYFAGKKEVAEYYRKKLTRISDDYPEFQKDGRPVSREEMLATYFKPGRIIDGYTGQDKVLEYRPVTDEGGWRVKVVSVDKAGNPLPGERPRTHFTAPKPEALTKVLKEEGYQRNEGKLYQVEVPEDHELLDYHKPLSGQSEGVRKSLEAGGIRQIFADQEEVDYSTKEGKDYVDNWLDNADGAEIYNVLQKYLGKGKGEAEAARLASEWLRGKGIPGLKYQDAQSRNPQRTLMFDGKPISPDSFQGLSKQESDALSAVDNIVHGDPRGATSLEVVLKRAEKFYGKRPAEYRAAIKSLGDRLKLHEESGTHNYVIWDDGRVDVKAKLYQEGQDGNGPRGMISFRVDPTGKPVQFDIHVLAGDRSTFAHETAHFLSWSLHEIAHSDLATEIIKKDYETLLKFAGYDSAEHRLAETKERTELTSKGELTFPDEVRLNELNVKEEKISHAWEMYLAEGKAPSSALSKVFSRFKDWMLRIYKGLPGIQAQFKSQYGEELHLSDEVRGVFDRMLAVDDSVQQAHRETGSEGPLSEAQSGMTPAEQEQYRKAIADSIQAAEAETQRRAADILNQRVGPEKERITKEVETELDKQPVYRAMRFLQTGELPDGQGGTLKGEDLPITLSDKDGKPFKLSRKKFVEKYGPDAARDTPAGVFDSKKRGGVDVDELAPMLGYDSGHELIQAFREAEPRQSVVDKQVQAKLDERFGPAMKAIQEAAMDAVHTDEALKRTVLELRGLAKQIDPSVARRVKAIDVKVIKDTAARMVSEGTVGDLDPARYARIERATAIKAADLWGKGEKEASVEQREARLLNQALYMAARDAKEELEKARDKMENVSEAVKGNLGKADPAYRDAHETILEAIGLGSGMGPDKGALGELLRVADRDQQEVAFDTRAVQQLLDTPKDWDSLTVDEARTVRDAVENIRHIARGQLELKLAGKRQLKDDWFNDFLGKLKTRPEPGQRPQSRTLNTGLKEKLGHLGRGADAMITDTETLASMLDAGDREGPVHKLLVDARLEARAKEAELTKKVLEVVREKWNDVPKDIQKLRDQKVDVGDPLPVPQSLQDKGYGGSYTRDQLWMLWLNWGSESNRQRIRDGNGWTDGNVLKALSKLSKPEMNFLQGIADSIESLYPELASMYEGRTGLKLGKVDTSPFEVNGEKFKGHYFPLKYDARAAKQGQMQEGDAIKSIFAPNYVRPVTPTGHTKARLDRVVAPVDLAWGVVPAHMAQVIHDISYGDWVRQTAGVLLDPRFQAAAEKYLGPERAKQFVPWLRDVANARVDSAAASNIGFLNELGGFGRSRAAVAVMGANIPMLAMNFIDAFNAIQEDVGSHRIASAYLKVMNPRNWNAIPEFKLSKELAYREAQMADNLRKELQTIGPVKGGLAHGIAETANKLNELMDQFTSRVTFKAAFDQALSDGMTQEEAARRADDVVRRVSVSHDIAEKSPIQRTKNGVAGLVMFYSFANKAYNSLRRRADTIARVWGNEDATAGDKTTAVATMAAKMMMMGVVGAGATYLAGRGPKQGEDRKKWLALRVLLEPLNTIPFVGGLAEKAVTGQKISMRTSPELALVGDAVGRIADLWNSGKSGEIKAEAAANLLLLTIGAPVGQINRTAGYVKQLHTGEARPRGPLDVAGGLIYGQKKDKSANPLTDIQGMLKH